VCAYSTERGNRRSASLPECVRFQAAKNIPVPPCTHNRPVFSDNQPRSNLEGRLKRRRINKRKIPSLVHSITPSVKRNFLHISVKFRPYIRSSIFVAIFASASSMVLRWPQILTTQSGTRSRNHLLSHVFRDKKLALTVRWLQKITKLQAGVLINTACRHARLLSHYWSSSHQLKVAAMQKNEIILAWNFCCVSWEAWRHRWLFYSSAAQPKFLDVDF